MSFISRLKKMFHHDPPVIEKPAETKTEPKSVAKPIFVDGKLINIEVQGLQGFQTQDELDFFKESIVYLAQALSSPEFKDRFMKLRPSEMGGHNLEFVYKQLMSGWDQAVKKEDGIINIYFTLYSSGASRTIGYTYGFQKIWTARYWFSQWYAKRDHAWMAGHLAHEYFHCLGYFHRYSHQGTLVYESGYLVTKVINEMKRAEGLEVNELEDMECLDCEQ